MIMMQEEFYTVDELAQRLRVSRETIVNWLKKGVIASYKVGRQWRVSHTDFEQYMKSQRRA
jgi:putative molybdopterin biosynthesis protein